MGAGRFEEPFGQSTGPACAIVQHGAAAADEPQMPLQIARFGEKVDLHLAVGSEAHRHSRVREPIGWSHPVGEIRLGTWADTNVCSRTHKLLDFPATHVDRVNRGEVWPEQAELIEQLHRPALVFLDACGDILRLLGDMHVDDTRGLPTNPFEPGSGNRSQTVRCNADRDGRVILSFTAQGMDRIQKSTRTLVREATLRRAQRLSVPSSLIRYPQQRDPKAHIPRRSYHLLRKLTWIRIRGTRRISVEVVELPNSRDPSERHFQKRLPRGHIELLGLEYGSHSVHQLTPAPEIIRSVSGL